MLKNIRVHIEKDEQKQEELEAKLAERINTIHKANINAFQRNIPSLMPYVTATQSQNLSIFCNKFGHFNIVDYGLGRVLYGFDPEKDALDQVEAFAKHSQFIHLHTQNNAKSDQSLAESDSKLLDELPKLEQYLHYPTLPNKVECLVVLGIGLGYHILELIKRCSPKFLIIYEPEPQYFAASTLVQDWKAVFDLAKENDIYLFFQLEKDGRDILGDIEELNSGFPINGFYLYKHYNHPIFNSITNQLAENSWQQIQAQGFHFNLSEDPNHYCHTYSSTTALEQYGALDKKDEQYQKNIDAFKKYFPDIAKKFSDYTPSVWIPARTVNGEVNLVNKENLICWYSDEPKQESKSGFEAFSDFPNKDGLVLGYTGKKLAHYLHYKFVKDTDKLLEEVEDEEGALPEKIQSIIMFGLGVGYQLETLIETHTVEKLFLCEPNADFFYGSLFAIDWEKVLKAIDKENSKFYINIGDDGTNLFRDLLNQFYSIGPYILNNTYFYQSYYNASLNLAIAKLREQLQVVISMGEYFDHAYHGIAQTKEALKREIPSLVRSPEKQLTYDDKDVPVFLVGNGPSLDQSFELIKEWKDKAIIVSCGTSLQVMHRNGIVPDFHAEIEQNRTSFDWASVIGDFDYLKQVSLVSCNGIHPDTCSLYKDVFIAFKEGESSTVSTLEIIGEKNFSVLQFAFPTVANFACNLFSTLGFRNIYLIGIDMGFINDKRHHSMQSAYYKDDGEEMYEYAKTINTSLVVPGNFRKTVFTKHEFKIAKMVLEQAIAQAPKDISFYNCSDGAQIFGSHPLPIDSVLITSQESEKQSAVTHLKEQAFMKLDGQDVIKRYEDRYADTVLAKELDAFKGWIDKPVESFEDAERMIDQQKNLLFLSYKNGRSLLFYYLYGTVNYANAMLTRLLYASREKGVEQFKKGLEVWQRYFTRFEEMIVTHQDAYDVSTSPNDLNARTYNWIQYLYRDRKVAVVSNSQCNVDAMQYLSEHYAMQDKVSYLNNEAASQSSEQFDYVIYFNNPELSQPDYEKQPLPLLGQAGTLVITYDMNRDAMINIQNRESLHVTFFKVAKDPRPFATATWICDPVHLANTAFIGVLESQNDLLMLKYQVIEGYDADEFASLVKFNLSSSDSIFHCSDYVMVDFDGSNESDGAMQVGYRGKRLQDIDDYHLFVHRTGTRKVYDNKVKIHGDLVPSLFEDKPYKGE